MALLFTCLLLPALFHSCTSDSSRSTKKREDRNKDNIVCFVCIFFQLLKKLLANFFKRWRRKVELFLCVREINKLAADFCHDCYDDFTLLLQHSTAADNSADNKQAEAKKVANLQLISNTSLSFTSWLVIHFRKVIKKKMVKKLGQPITDKNQWTVATPLMYLR